MFYAGPLQLDAPSDDLILDADTTRFCAPCLEGG
jgi:hypothetical protein